MRLLVCGGRHFKDKEFLYYILDRFHKENNISVVIEGDARGADRMAGFWARKNKVDNLKYPANWDKYGKSAGHIRNQQMLDDGLPDVVIAFAGGAGTKNMIAKAKKQNIKVYEFNS